MEMRLCHVYNISCCVLLILSYIEAKSVSLNDIIAAEEQASQRTTRRSTRLYTLAESSETYEPRGNKFKGNLFTANERDVVCTCKRKSNSGSTLHPQEETIASASAVATEIQETIIASTIATTTQTFTTIDDNVRRIGRNKNVPVLPTGNSTSVWRNDNGFGQRGSSPFHGSFEGYITRNNGNNEHDTGEEAGAYTENYEEYTDSYSRNDAERDRSSQRLRGLGNEPRDTELDRGTIEEEFTLPRSETFEDVTRNLPEHERKIEYQIRRDETESSLSVPELDSRLRGFNSQEKGTTIRHAEISKESVTENSASDKRFSDRNGSLTSENQEIRSANEAIAPRRVLPNSTYPVGKVVMIFDGYSVAKDVNGANRLTEKAIQIHT
ncbi:uncharacterized protein LOC123867336 isoform X2 [Maniola jurtina]|uniref:uncharacterized protein LOC123867336 isoform X2 n=1 Tax=Maniola jurtina TaxID=191418 RepID=UPI001E689269|nr:uncharacterized protein LOC123867336 isoform X2 [Maniola jurtina]